ncbi:hypothetical protein ACOHYD_03090 [Desulfobacterota bacterium M19]
MLDKRHRSTDSERECNFQVDGRIQREQPECQPGELKLSAYLFDKAGMLLGRTDIDQNGKYCIEARLSSPMDVKLVVGPQGDAQQIRHSSAFSHEFSAAEWEAKGRQFRLHYDTLLPLYVWRPWFSNRICISGHVRKVELNDGGQRVCPVPYLKVEIFDVDREACWWPWLRRWWEHLLDRPVIRVPDLLRRPRFPLPPFPGPDPAPELNLDKITGMGANIDLDFMAALSPQARQFSTRSLSEPFGSGIKRAAINPQPEPPGLDFLPSSFMRVGESRLMDSSVAARFDKLTLTSWIAPWFIFPGCFYSKRLVCETTTDCNGFFSCCFNWWPLQFRQGRLRFDSRPDIIVRITQVVNGVASIIYMDPYTSTRWNVTNAHLDLFLDDEEVVCGNGHCHQELSGSPVFFTRVGDDEVYQINQATGLYNDQNLKNVAYGHTLYLYGQFGDMLTASDVGHGDPPPYFYYRLSYAERGSEDDEFKFIDVNLNDTRVDKVTLSGHSHKLGPYNVNGVPCLYEIRNFNDYYWYNPDWIGIWHSWLAERDTGEYILRLEVFDRSGNKLNTDSGLVDYRNGAGIGNGSPPAPMPAMTDHCDLLITLDNKRPVAEITVPAVLNECGVIRWHADMRLDIQITVSQENNRLHKWQLWYTKGVGSEHKTPYGSEYSNGLPGSISTTVPGAALLGLDNLTTTCAFALRLGAWAHVRNGRQFIYYAQDIDAIAIEKCPGA